MVTNAEERGSIEERVSRLERAYDSLAANADVTGTLTELAKLRTQIAEGESRTAQRIADAQARNTRWLIAVAVLIVAAVTLLDRLFG